MQRRLFAGATFVFATAALLGSGLLASPSARGQSNTLVWLDPHTDRVDHADGSYQLDVKLSGLDHHGTIGYDTNRDGRDDRFEDSNGLGAYELTLHFDPNVVLVTDMDAGEFLRSEGRSTQCLQRKTLPGEFAMGCVSFGNSDGPQGSGSLATFTIEPVANGTSFLALEAGLAGPLGDSIEIVADGGLVEVYNGPSQPPPTGGPGGQPTGPPGGSPVVNGTPVAPATATYVALATASARATSIALGTPVDDGTPDTAAGPPDTGGGDGGSNAMPWVIGISVAAVLAIALLVASRFVIRARRV
ncbi:MAG: cohesin domain-containing protein [Dehalococcoidia bacterium]